MRKQYGVANVDQKEYVERAAAQGGSAAVTVPLVKFDGEWNPKIVAGEFELPPAKDRKDLTLEVAHRILGILVTKDLLGHLPQNVTSEHVGNLLPFYPLAYHKRFGATYSDRVCPASTRTGRCPVCAGRRDLFASDAYKNSVLSKDAIMKAGFGTRNVALVISRVFFDGEDLGIRAWTTNLTNEMAANAKHDNFFDMVQQLATPKKLLAGEVLPTDYYSNGEGARWLVAEYVRATYEDKGTPGDQKSKRAPAPYWKLSKITPMKEIEGVGKAKDIWWPEFGTGKNAKDGTELVDVYALINHTAPEELENIAADSVNFLLNPKKKEEKGDDDAAAGGDAEAEVLDAPTWDDIVDMDTDELIRYGVNKGGKERDLALTGASNIAALRRCVAKLWNVIPKPAKPSAGEAEEDAGGQDSEHLPF